MPYTRLSMNFQPKSARQLRRQFLLGSLVALAGWKSFVNGISPALAAYPLPIQQAAPPMTQAIIDQNGDSFRIDSFHGQPVLINFWATWCTPCVAEMKSLQMAAERLQPDGIEVLLISVDHGDVDKALAVLQSNGVTAPRFGFDPKAELFLQMGVEGLPTSFLLSADHLQCLVYFGPREWHEDSIQTDMRNFLNNH